MRLYKEQKKGWVSFPAFFILLSILSNSGCSLYDIEGKKSSLFNRAIIGGWSQKVLQTEMFDLFTLDKVMDSNIPHAAIYIEGDGLAWIDKITVSPNPTPKRPIGLRLALLDPSPNTLYLSRPCQYLTETHFRNCHPKYWTHHRYSSDVIESIDEAITLFKRKNRIESLEIIGYSGGGSIAALISNRRTDVVRFITIASNLDIDAWAKIIDVSPLWGSKNPANNTIRSRKLEQYHLTGGRDTVVPRFVLDQYLFKAKVSLPKSIISIKDFTHSCCWHKVWKDMILKIRSTQS